MRRPLARFVTLFALLAGAASHSFAAPAPAPAAPVEGQVYFAADEMGYDQDKGLIVAHGKVEAVQGDYVLRADKVTYFQISGVVEASGNVSLLQPDGNVLFAEKMQLKDDLAQGMIHQFRVRLTDDSRFAANEAKKVSPSRYKLKKAVYSPCKLCRDPETGGEKHAPLWQLKADRITIDTLDQSVEYYNAFMEVFGVPVMYTPYFTHPTPGADRKTGILIPQYSQNSQLGTTLQMPVYINIAPDIDATLTPFLTSKEGPVMIGQYRQITDGGYFQFDGSITDPDKRDEAGNTIDGQNEIRGHIFARGSQQVSDHWSAGFDINRTTDDTYLRRYKFGNQDTLSSRVYTEMINKRNYIGVEGLTFQGLQEEDDPDRTPWVLPSAKISVESDPLFMGSRASFEASGRTLERDLGAESRRATVKAGYRIPYVTDGGNLFEANASVRTDGYSVSDAVLPDGTETSGSVARTIPQLALTWRYPMITYVDNASLTVEPTVELVASSNGNNPQKIPNEDSRAPEFSDLNLFSTDRFPGYDRVEDGTHMIYGMRGEYRLESGQTVEAMLGQDLQLLGDRVFPVSDELSEDLSDYVGRLGLGGQHYEADYRFRMDAKDYNVNRNELHGGVNFDPVGVYADYLEISDDPLIENREEGMLSSTLRLSDQWSWNAYGRRDFDDKRMIAAGSGLQFANECITIITRLDREYLRDRDLRPDTSLTVRLLLKNLN